MVAITAERRSGLLHDRRTRAGRYLLSDARPPARRPSAAVATRRYQLAGALAAMFAACAVWVQAGGAVRPGSGPLAVPGAGPTQVVSDHVWVVQPGETVWGIAHHLQPHGDVRPLVDALDQQLHGRPLQIGERLQLP